MIFFLSASSSCSSTSATSTSTSSSTTKFKESPKKAPKHPKHPKHKKKKKRKHEIFIKGGENCQRTCRGLNWPCCIIHKKAPDAWYCIIHYARNKWGVCIPIKSHRCQKEKLPTCVCGPGCEGNPAAEEYQWKSDFWGDKWHWSWLQLLLQSIWNYTNKIYKNQFRNVSIK